MFDTLSTVPWAKLRDAYGPARPIPRALRALLGPAAGLRAKALDTLWMGLCPQRADVSEASAAAVPYLLELVAERSAAERVAVLELVQGLAEVAARPAHGVEARPGACEQNDEPAQSSFRSAVRAALRSGRQVLEHTLDADDAELRARAALTLAQLASDDDEARALSARLSERWTHEADAATRVAYLVAFERLAQRAPLRAALSDASQAVCTFAALLLLSDGPSGATAARLVSAAWPHRQAIEADFAPAARYTRLDWVARVCAAGRERALAHFAELLALLVTSPAERASSELAPLLALFFPGSPPALPDAAQAALVATVARNRAYFGTLASGTALLARRGLPVRPRRLREYAQQGAQELAHLVPTAPRHSLEEALTALPADLEQLELVAADGAVLLHALRQHPSLEDVRLVSTPVSEAGLAALAALPALRFLRLEDLQVEAKGMRALARSARLERLWITDASLSDGELAELGVAPALRFLCLTGCPVTGRALSSFRTARLDTLFLRADLSLDPAGAAVLPDVRSLKTLSFLGTGITGPWLDALVRLEQLARLELRREHVPGALVLPPSLEELDLENATLEPCALDHLSDCLLLRKVEAIGVQLKPRHVDALAACPRLQILRLSRSIHAHLDTAGLMARVPGLRLDLV